MKKGKIIIIVLIVVVAVTLITMYTIKTNKSLNTNEKFINYEGDILPLPYGSSDIDIYSDGKIWAKSIENGKVKEKITDEDMERLKEKLKEIDYMNFKNEYNLYGKGNYEEITINFEENKKQIRFNYIMSRYDSTNAPKELNEFMRLLKDIMYEKTK